ncbi:hypothetical protein EJ73_00724 [Hoylesella shahii DSM 15611 = JCM 12083]|uniref:Uncharacterized protein n=1 Tax=Hoylesella shahii DSM 15611 = JCM 12083 TaxID=1122991 RepID=A0A318HXK4_9BACT|nr:hypothetical protein EJ73_00724 [Hoylesella shahii DSM 15611 = JCM 12083]
MLLHHKCAKGIKDQITLCTTPLVYWNLKYIRFNYKVESNFCPT